VVFLGGGDRGRSRRILDVKVMKRGECTPSLYKKFIFINISKNSNNRSRIHKAEDFLSIVS